MAGTTIGIDLGTTNSCAAYHDGRSVHIIETAEGHRIMPSVIGLQKGGARPLVGRAGLRSLFSNAEYTFRYVKRIIGRLFDEQAHGSFQYIEGANGEVWLDGPDRPYSASELQSYLIKSIIDAAEAKLGKRPDGVVVTVPANFDARQQAATREAVIKAGISVKRVQIIQEPGAAALAYGIDQQKFDTVAVYDLGGGTFDVSILRCGSHLNRTIGEDGNAFLGGVDFDDRLIKWVTDKWMEDHGQDLMAKPPSIMARVRDACEAAKIDLTTRETARIYADHLTAERPDGVLSLNYEISRDQFIELTSDLIDETIEICGRAMDRAGISLQDIDHVILVGGMTRVPAIQDAVTEYFGQEALKNIVPEEAVASGAATFAAMGDNRIGSSVFESVTPVSTGIENASGEMTVAIAKGSLLPSKKKFERSLSITTHSDDQDCCTIHVVQGEQAGASDNTTLAVHHVLVDPAPAGEVTIKVDFEVDENRALHVFADGEKIWSEVSDDLHTGTA